MERFFFLCGSISGFLAVVLGAFAAHALKDRLAPDMASTFEVGVRYQMYHAFALLAVGWAATRWPTTSILTAGWLFLVGTIIFSGSLYGLSLTGSRWLGAVTPVGGLAFLLGWLCLAWGTLR
jgi:uncharacterized membrane protein YgdD (TMEM256/DUF423 family)